MLQKETQTGIEIDCPDNEPSTIVPCVTEGGTTPLIIKIPTHLGTNSLKPVALRSIQEGRVLPGVLYRRPRGRAPREDKYHSAMVPG